MNRYLEVNRLSAADEAAITARVVDTVEGWVAQRVPAHIAAGADLLMQLGRSACHAIGCSVWDLRDSELGWIEEACRVVVADRFALSLPEVARCSFPLAEVAP